MDTREQIYAVTPYPHAPLNQLLKQWTFTAPPALAITNDVADFIIIDGHHASIVEGEGFQQLLNLTEPRYVCPSRTYFQHVSHYAKAYIIGSAACLSRRIYLRCNKVKLLHKQALHDQFPSLTNHISLSSSNQSSIFPAPILTILFRSRLDMWTGPDHESYICLTVTGSPYWKLQHALLDILLH